jgi:L-aminoadipate-semialdehyde dehydrogenase
MRWEAGFAGRFRAVVGDLGRPLLGMTREEFLQIANEIDAVVHNGAMVHWVYPYSQLKAYNVGGTVEALRLATSGSKLAAFHFVSSTSVFDRQACKPRAAWRPPPHWQLLSRPCVRVQLALHQHELDRIGGG